MPKDPHTAHDEVVGFLEITQVDPIARARIRALIPITAAEAAVLLIFAALDRGDLDAAERMLDALLAD